MKILRLWYLSPYHESVPLWTTFPRVLTYSQFTQSSNIFQTIIHLVLSLTSNNTFREYIHKQCMRYNGSSINSAHIGENWQPWQWSLPGSIFQINPLTQETGSSYPGSLDNGFKCSFTHAMLNLRPWCTSGYHHENGSKTKLRREWDISIHWECFSFEPRVKHFHLWDIG